MKVCLYAIFTICFVSTACFSQQNVPCKCQEGITQIPCNVCSGKGTTGKCLVNACNAGKVKGQAKAGCKTYRYHYNGYYSSSSTSSSNNKCGCADCAVPCGTCEGTGLRSCLKCKRLGTIPCTRANNSNHVAPDHSVNKKTEGSAKNTDSEAIKDGNEGDNDIVAQLKKLRKLKDAGILTDEEYDLKRRSLVDKLTDSQ